MSRRFLTPEARQTAAGYVLCLAAYALALFGMLLAD